MDIWKTNLSLMQDIFNEEVTDEDTFTVIRSIFADEWYNFIVPKSAEIDWQLAEDQIAKLNESGKKVSYYISADLVFSGLEEELVTRGYQFMEDDTYMVLDQLTMPQPEVKGISIEEAVDADFEEYASVAGISFPEWENNREFAELMFKYNKPDKYVQNFVARDGDQIVAITSTVIQPDEGVAYLTNAAVLPEYRRRGINTAMAIHQTVAAQATGVEIVYSLVAHGGASWRNLVRIGFKQQAQFNIFSK